MKINRRPLVTLCTAAIMIVAALPAPAEAFYLPDSDQRKCYQGVSPYAEIPCGRTGQDGAYVKNPLSYTDNGDGTVTDNNTGLMWQQQDDGWTYSWSTAAGICSSLVTGGHTDWRLPTKKELMSIVDYKVPFRQPHISPVFRSVHAAPYWSSTPLAGFSGSAWRVSFLYGDVENYSPSVPWYVRCVRGAQIPGPFLKVNADRTVTDAKTGLVWDGVPYHMTWAAALSHCEARTSGGSSNWRLPNVKELESLTSEGRYNPAYDAGKLPHVEPNSFWSSTSYVGDGTSFGYAFYVSFYNGRVGSAGKNLVKSVMCVQGGRAGQLTVTAPDGGQKWARGTRHMITWASKIQGGTVAIKLMKGAATYKTIATAAPNTGAYLWRVPGTLLRGNTYRIKIISNTKSTVFDLSNRYFTIF